MKRLLAAGLAAFAVLASAPAAFASHSWSGYHWARSANPFALTFDNYVTSPWTTYLSGASGDWGAKGTGTDFYGSFTANSPVTPSVTGNLGTDRKCRPIAGQVKVCDATYGNNGWLGVASISTSRGHITQATVKLNDTYYASGSVYDTPAWRAAVLCQETGHTIGLDHQDTSGANFHTCMDYATTPDQYNEHQPRRLLRAERCWWQHRSVHRACCLRPGVADSDLHAPGRLRRCRPGLGDEGAPEAGPR